MQQMCVAAVAAVAVADWGMKANFAAGSSTGKVD
jgi:hypothetical protein